ncbi:MAG: hypothetical protein ABGZ35_27955 [Planctomycetaceae bacterium]
MTTSPQADLILLIRLLHDDLPPPEGAYVREKIGDSKRFADKYHAVAAAKNRTRTPEESIAGLETVDVERVARFIDEALPPQQQAEFETACWQVPSLLYEVMATWRAARQPNTAVVPPVDFGARMLSSIRTAAGRESAEQLDRAVPSSPRRLSPRPPALQGDRAQSEPRQRRRSTQRTAVAVAVGLVATIAVALLLSSRFSRDAQLNRIATEDRPPGNEPDRRSNGVRPDRRDVVHDDSSGVVDTLPDGPLSITPERIRNVLDHPEQPLEQTVVEMNPALQPTPTLPRVNALPTRRSVIRRWRNIAGVVAVRSEGQSQWHGVHSDSAKTAISDSVANGILTFANSQATAELSSGCQLVLGTETFVQPIGGELQPPDLENNEVVDELRLEYGRVAVVGLSDQERLRVSVGNRTLEVQSVGRRADFMVEQSSGTILCAVRRGVVEVNEQRVTPENWLQFDSLRPTSVKPRERALRWIDDPAAGLEIPKQICEALNHADNIYADTQALLGSGNQRVAQFAARTLIELADVRDPDVIPESFIRVGVDSGSEVRRVALVRWILSAMERQPDRTDAIWDAVLRHAGRQNGNRTPRLTNTARDDLREICHAAIHRVSPDLNRIRKLAQQLQPTHHVFVRQSAKFFLEKILEEELSEYNPVNPSRRAITSVMQKIRRWRNTKS